MINVVVFTFVEISVLDTFAFCFNFVTLSLSGLVTYFGDMDYEMISCCL